jgi:hypothetical protein
VNRLNKLTLVLVAVLMVTTMSPAQSFDLPSWSVSGGADAATQIASASGGFANVVTDSSEDGSIVAVVWRSTANPGQTTATIGWTDGTTTNWSTPTGLNSNVSRTGYYQSVAVSGDGQTVVATWIESNGTDDDIKYALGAISVNPSTHVPTVTWGTTGTFVDSQHQWWPTVDISYNGTKVVIVYWDLNSSTWNFVAMTATVSVSGTSRTPTFKGPATITTPDWSWTPSSPAMQLKVSRDGTRAIAAWWSSYTPISSGHGRIEASVADIGPSIPFPSSLSGSAWSGRQVLSASNSYYTSPPALDFSDDGSKAIVSWQGQAGTGASDLKFAASSIATLSNATTATWSSMVKHYESTSAAYGVQNSISADGTRALVGWGIAATASKSGMTMTVGSIASNGTPTWETPVSPVTNTANYSYTGIKMSRNGTMGVGLTNVGTAGSDVVMSTASNIWSNGSSLQTDWSTNLQSLSSATSQVNYFAPLVTVASDGSVITAIWASSTKLWSRSVTTGSPTVSSVSPTFGDIAGGGTITITGSSFRPGATVTIGGAACTSPNVVSSTQITCTIPAASAGVVDVIVTNVDNHTGTATQAFSYNAPTTTTTTTTTTLAPTTTTIAPSTTIAVSNATTTTVAAGVSPTTTPANNGVTTTTAVQNNGNGSGAATTTTVDPSASTQDVNSRMNAPSTTNPDLDIVIEQSVVKNLPTRKLVIMSGDNKLDSTVQQGGSISITTNGFSAKEKVLALIGTTTFRTVASSMSDDAGSVNTEFVVPTDLSGPQTLALYAPESGNGAQMSITVRAAAIKALPDSVEDNASSSGESSALWWLVGPALILVLIFLFIAKKRRDEDED